MHATCMCLVCLLSSALYVCLVCLPYMSVLHVCLTCLSYISALYVCRKCLPYESALYVCLTFLPYMSALHVCLTCLPDMSALYVGLICLPYMSALYVCLGVCSPRKSGYIQARGGDTAGTSFFLFQFFTWRRHIPCTGKENMFFSCRMCSLTVEYVL